MGVEDCVGVVRLVTPPTDNAKTGGHIYNARVAEILGGNGALHQCVVPPGAIGDWLRRTAARPNSPGDPPVIVLDSLYISAARALHAARADDRVARQRWLLLAHLLPTQEHDGEDERRAEEIALPLFDGAIAPSRYMRELLRRRGVPGQRLYACPPGTDLPSATARATDTAKATATTAGRDHNSHSSKPVQILTVANWIPRKNLEGVLDALEQLKELSWQWKIVGHAAQESRYADRLKQRIAASPVGERVATRGTLEFDELDALWRETEVFALATRFESYGMVFAEALSYGVPVVAPEICAVPEIVANGVSGILYDPAHQDGLRNALRSLIENPARRRSLSSGARAEAQRLTSWQQTAECFLAACSE